MASLGYDWNKHWGALQALGDYYGQDFGDPSDPSDPRPFGGGSHSDLSGGSGPGRFRGNFGDRPPEGGEDRSGGDDDDPGSDPWGNQGDDDPIGSGGSTGGSGDSGGGSTGGKGNSVTSEDDGFRLFGGIPDGPIEYGDPHPPKDSDDNSGGLDDDDSGTGNDPFLGGDTNDRGTPSPFDIDPRSGPKQLTAPGDPGPYPSGPTGPKGSGGLGGSTPGSGGGVPPSGGTPKKKGRGDQSREQHLENTPKDRRIDLHLNFTNRFVPKDTRTSLLSSDKTKHRPRIDTDGPFVSSPNAIVRSPIRPRVGPARIDTTKIGPLIKPDLDKILDDQESVVQTGLRIQLTGSSDKLPGVRAGDPNLRERDVRRTPSGARGIPGAPTVNPDQGGGPEEGVFELGTALIIGAIRTVGSAVNIIGTDNLTPAQRTRVRAWVKLAEHYGVSQDLAGNLYPTLR